MDLSTSQLDDYIRFVDTECNGNYRDPRAVERYFPLNVKFRTVVDESLDPFGDEYYAAQIALYREVAGRALDQRSGELHPDDIQPLLGAPNPLGVRDVDFIAEYVRALSSMLSLARLPAEARVLDMGAGHGVSSEVFAFCGARVHAIDIDPGLSDLARQRASARGLDIDRAVMNFDSLDTLEDGAYRAAFFFQSLHHCTRPWDLLATLERKLTDDGVVAFSGEPIQEIWWRQWGIRLDEEAVYVARKYGWFESGWSREFIHAAFQRAGLDLMLFDSGLNGSPMGIACKDPAKSAAILERAIRMGWTPLFANGISNAPRNFFTPIGSIARGPLGPTIRARVGHDGGFLCYGPYISLPPGRYRVSFALQLRTATPGAGPDARNAAFDVTCADRPEPLLAQAIRLAEGETMRFVSLVWEERAPMRRVEARVRIPTPREPWEMTLPYFEREFG